MGTIPNNALWTLFSFVFRSNLHFRSRDTGSLFTYFCTFTQDALRGAIFSRTVDYVSVPANNSLKSRLRANFLCICCIARTKADFRLLLAGAKA